jgi:hypothetical protein
MTVAACDPDAFYPLRSLVTGPFHNLGDIAAIEQFLRTVVLHDEIVMEITPTWYDPESDREWTEEEERAGGRVVITGYGPVLDGFDFFTDTAGPTRPVPEIELSPQLINEAARYANAGEGNVYFDAAIEYLKRLLGVVKQGGSVLVSGGFGQQVISVAGRFPEDLFRQLDRDWQDFAERIEQDGLDFLVPPVLGVILTRCARRDAIPAVLRDLREEWSDARRRVWQRLDALRTCRTLREALEIHRELAEASRLFSPSQTEANTRPLRALWEILAAAASGAATGQLAGGSPAIGAATNTLGQLARSLPALAQDFGPALFGRGAFDLARRVRRETASVEFDALRRLLSAEEIQTLGLG